MADQPTDAGMVGPFWVVEADKRAAVIALAVPLERADAYGDMKASYSLPSKGPTRAAPFK